MPPWAPRSCGGPPCRAIFAFHERRAAQEGVAGQCGSVTFLQRFGSALQANLHFHVLAPDGVFTPDGFHELSPPEDEEVEALLATIARRVMRLLVRRGRLEEDVELDALGGLQAESVQARLPLSDQAAPPRRRRRTAVLEGFSLHADVWGFTPRTAPGSSGSSSTEREARWRWSACPNCRMGGSPGR